MGYVLITQECQKEIVLVMLKQEQYICVEMPKDLISSEL